MNEFSKNSSTTGDGLAALAILRSLMRVLRARGVLDDPAINAIITDAHEQLKGMIYPAANDARGIASDLRESVIHAPQVKP